MTDHKLRLLLFNLKTDADDALLGFTTLWINELALYCEYIDIITMQSGRIDVADNVRVYSVGREKGYSEPRRAMVFYGLLPRLLLTRRYDACFAHMMPLFAGMGGPLLAARRVPLTLWYTHRQVSAQLRLALRMSKRVVSAVPDSFPIPTAKLRPIGHGIDTDFFTPSPSNPRPVIVHVARLMAIKNQAVLLRAASSTDAEVVFVGDVPEGKPQAYKGELLTLAGELGMAERVTFTGDLPAREVRDWYRRATVAINLSPPGLFDKATLEAMACGVPTINSNPAFDSLTGDYTPQLRTGAPDDVEGLAERLRGVLALSDSERTRMGAELRERVVETHSLKRLIPRLVSVLATGEIKAPTPFN